MIDATLLFSRTTVYSPWFPRQADMLRVVAECVAISGAQLVIDLLTKSASDTGDGQLVNSSVNIVLGSVGRSAATEWATTISNPGVKQLLRFRFTTSGHVANDWIMYRLLPAVWYDAVEARLQ